MTNEEAVRAFCRGMIAAGKDALAKGQTSVPTAAAAYTVACTEAMLNAALRTDDLIRQAIQRGMD